MGFKLEERKGLWEGWDSKELWKSVEKSKSVSRVVKDQPIAFCRSSRESWFTHEPT